MPGKPCRVTYKDLEGVRHTVDVVAETVYKASVLALSVLSKNDWVENVGPGTKLEVQIVEPNVTHTLVVAQLNAWLDEPAKSPAELTRKKKLQAMLAG
jgi:hypothetical protein